MFPISVTLGRGHAMHTHGSCNDEIQRITLTYFQKKFLKDIYMIKSTMSSDSNS